MAASQLPVPDTQPSIKAVTTPTSTSGNTAPAPASIPAGLGAAAGAGTGAVDHAHNVFSELVFAFIGTAALAIIANMNERLGRVLVAIMAGFLFMWVLLHSGQVAGWIDKAVPQAKPAA